MADERLPAEEVAAQRASMEMWTLAHRYPMLPWSVVVMESVPAAQQAARGADFHAAWCHAEQRL